MYFSVKTAEYITDFKIKIIFNNGKSGTVDLHSYIQDGEIFNEINTIDEFKKFTIEFGTLIWKDGEIDIAPKTLYELATGEKIVFPINQKHKAV